ncbi:MAG TPA: multicopper oxidase domain-containing protein [Candidatus Thermoplasmatota archaeon]|nr:multicopper oxidase domain-containing protein [Candidatus Thermoplasmatota archaeon]
MPRASVLVVLAVAAVVAGCTSDGEVEGASSSSADRAARADAMLAHPPGSDVRPTGVVKEFTLYVHPMSHELYPDATMAMWGFSLSEDPTTATVPGPMLRVTEGDTVRVTLVSLVAGFNHTIHWHGQHVPNDQDGVPFVTQDPVEPSADHVYEFVAKPAGTYWYHCHVDAQHHVDMGMYGVLIVDPQDPAQDPRFDREFVMVLDDMDRFHVEGGQPTGSNAPQSLDPFAYEAWLRRQASDAANRNAAVQDATGQTGVRPQRSEEYGYPITHAPYTADYNTFLINGQAFPFTQPLVVEEGEVARIRLVNAGNSLFAMHLHGHHVLVTHKDGVLLESPYWADTVPLAPGERFDVHVKLDNPGLWDFHDHVGGHTQNDNIFPGGAMTMLCYASTGKCGDGSGHGHGARRSGELLGWTGRELP